MATGRAQPARELADRAAIRTVLLRYAAGIDGRDLSAVSALFVAGAVYQGSLGTGTIESALANLQGRFDRYQRTMHWIDHQLIEIQGDAARSEAYAVAYHRLKQASPASLVVGVRYLDELTRRQRGWLIVRRVVTSEWQVLRADDGGCDDE